MGTCSAVSKTEIAPPCPQVAKTLEEEVGEELSDEEGKEPPPVGVLDGISDDGLGGESDGAGAFDGVPDGSTGGVPMGELEGVSGGTVGETDGGSPEVPGVVGSGSVGAAGEPPPVGAPAGAVGVLVGSVGVTGVTVGSVGGL